MFGDITQENNIMSLSTLSEIEKKINPLSHEEQLGLIERLVYRCHQ